MKTTTVSKLTPFLAMLVLILPLLGAAGSPAAKTKKIKLSQKQLVWLIGHAETPAEHEELAAYYRQQAQHLLQEAKEHQEMAAAYPQVYASKHPTLAAHHCNDWAALYSKQAKDAEALAKLHEQMAKEAAEKKP